MKKSQTKYNILLIFNPVN